MKLGILVTWEVSWTQPIEIEVADDATQDEAREAADAATERAIPSILLPDGTWAEADRLGWRWKVRPTFRRRTMPPDDAWFELDGHQWATNRQVLVRRDAVNLPDLNDGEIDLAAWVKNADPDLLASVRALLASPREPSFKAEPFRRVYAVALRAGDRIVQLNSVSLAAERKGEIIAVAAHLHTFEEGAELVGPGAP